MVDILDAEGQRYSPNDPKYDKVRIDNLQTQVRELQTAVIDLQNRMSRVDKEDLQWPADSYEPTHTRPFEG